MWGVRISGENPLIRVNYSHITCSDMTRWMHILHPIFHRELDDTRPGPNITYSNKHTRAELCYLAHTQQKVVAAIVEPSIEKKSIFITRSLASRNHHRKASIIYDETNVLVPGFSRSTSVHIAGSFTTTNPEQMNFFWMARHVFVACKSTWRFIILSSLLATLINSRKNVEKHKKLCSFCRNRI